MIEEEERRQSTRQRLLKNGKIIFNDSKSVIDCVVRNRSETGARLKVDSPIGIPHDFLLKIGEQEPRACSVVWRRSQELGVRFT